MCFIVWSRGSHGGKFAGTGAAFPVGEMSRDKESQVVDNCVGIGGAKESKRQRNSEEDCIIHL